MSEASTIASRALGAVKFFMVEGHIECRFQIRGRRYHPSWPSWTALQKDLEAWFLMRELGVDLQDLIRRLKAGENSTEVLNVGPKGAMEFDSFCTKIFEEHRSKKPGWKWESKRRDFVIRQRTFAGRPMHTIRAEEIQRWFTDYSSRPGVTSDNSRANMLKVMKAVFGLATTLGYLRVDPTRDIHLPAVPDSRGRAFTHNETIRLFNAADKNLRLWILLTLYSGLRPIEIQRLTVAAIDLTERRISVVGSTAKNRTRDLYIHDDLLPALKEVATAVPNLPLLRDAKDHAAPYPREAFLRARKQANLPTGTFYTLRHTFASRLLETGTRDEETRSYLMGHRKSGMTSRYTHITFPMVCDAIKRLPSITATPERPGRLRVLEGKATR